MKIQFLNWESSDITYGNSENTKFVIFGFGRTSDLQVDQSVCVVFQYFYPYFYVRVDEHETIKSIHGVWLKKFNELKAQKRNIRNKLRQCNIPCKWVDEYHGELIEEKTCEVNSHVFMGEGFENFKTHRFIRVYFKTLRSFKFFQHFIPYCNPNHKLYEANINPMLKMFHDQSFEPCSWLEFSENALLRIKDESKKTTADIEYSTYYRFFGDRIQVNRETNAVWFKLLSFDLECESSHGDYPVALKDYSKLIREIKRVATKKVKVDNLETVCRQINECRYKETELFSRLYLKKDCEDISVEDLLKWMHMLMSGDNEILYEEFHNFLKKCWGNTVMGDRIIQIGNVVEFPKGTYKKVIFCLDETVIENQSATDNILVFSCKTEAELIRKWADWFGREDPDIVMGYNIYNFDNEYLWSRAKECNVSLENRLTRITSISSTLKDMTKGHGKYIQMNGREMIDLMDYVKKNYSLDSYSLDNVSGRFIRGKIKRVCDKKVYIEGNPIGICDYDYFKIYINNGIYEEKYEYNKKSKFQIKSVNHDEKYFELVDELEMDEHVFLLEWCLSKDDITPQQIFQFQKGSKYERGLIAKYCIQDCMLCHYIYQKLEVLINNMAMANVCYVPFGFLFLRGQSVKIFSLISKICSDENYRIPVLNNHHDSEEEEEAEFYEGALVLEPKTGIYIDEPVTVNDFNSLYPSCGISENVCPSTIVLKKEYMNIEGYTYNEIKFDEYEYQVVYGKNGKPKKNKEPVKCGEKTCYYVVYPNEKKGILPMIWQKLLSERKQTRKRMEIEKDAFRKTLLDGLQLAFKTTANSMYGIFGFSKSPLYYKDVAASITATGRRNLMFAKEYIERNYPNSKIIYGDTDSLFVSFGSKKDTELEKIYECIDIATEAGDNISNQLKPPHNLGFEKCVSPFILMSRKRYTGLYYTSKSPKKYMNTMGFVLKRRDNALIVKEIVGNAIKKILFEKDITGSIAYIKESIQRMFMNHYGIDKFIITKTLKTTYSNPDQMCHVVLAKRIGERDPGNKPKVGDRIPYVFIDIGRETELQGDRVESPDYVMANGLNIDYGYYVTNQLMNPLMQVYSLLYGERTEELLFGDTLRFINQKKNNLTLITMYYDKCLKSEISIQMIVSEKRTNIKKVKKEDKKDNKLITSFFKSG